jgi:MFS family permease
LSPLLSESPVVLPIHRKILAFSFIGWIFDFYDLLLLSFLVATTTLRQDLSLTSWDISVLLGVGLAFTAVGGFVGGALGDKYGRKPLLMVTILIYSIGTLLSGLSVNFWMLLISRAITGFGVGGEWAVAHALVGETVPPHVRGRYGSYLQSGSAWARFLATSIAYSVSPVIGWRLTFMLSALPALIVVFIRRQMPESDIWLSHRKESKEQHRSQVAVVAEMLGPVLFRTTAIAFTLTVLNMAAYWFKTIRLPEYITADRGLSLIDSRNLLYMDQIGSLIGYVAFGYFSDRFGRRPSFTIFSMMKALGLFMVTLGWDTASALPGGLYLWMFVVGLGEGNWGCIGPLLNEVFPTSVRGAALGIIYNLARGAQFLAPPVILFMTTRYSFAAGIALAAPFAVLAGVSVWLLPETKGKRLAT